MARTPPLVKLLGSEAYGGFLDQLVSEARTRGLKIETRAGLVEHSLNRLGTEWGLIPPQRARPIGANQHPTNQPNDSIYLQPEPQED